MKINIKLISFYIFCSPIAIVWDIIFHTIHLIHNLAVMIDDKGSVLLDDLKDRAEKP